jgi:3-methyl-2-oxobutanoate hydroxymethyltransferase
MTKQFTVDDFYLYKKQNIQISMLTCYDYPSAKAMDPYIDIALVGDSLGTNVLGYQSENEVTIQDMCHHTKAVKRGLSQALLLADMPFNTYNNPVQALQTAKELITAGADAVKCEGFRPDIIRELRSAGIFVVGHLGLTPQFHDQKKLQAKTADSAFQCIQEAKALEEAGICALVIELVPIQVAKLLREHLSIPVIGIAAGPFCDGQVQVLHDILGLNSKVFKHVHRYDNGLDTLDSIMKQYNTDIKAETLVSDQHASHMHLDEFNLLAQKLSI